MEYPKIHSLWKRQGWYFDQEKKKSPDYQKGRQSFIVGDYAEPEFGNIKKWHVEEKIDGTNIRICFFKTSTGIFPNPLIGGRTDDAQLPTKLLSYLQTLATWENFEKAFPNLMQNNDDESSFSVWLFGEGYGSKIQACGGNYRSDPGFILFDVFVDGWWLKREDVKLIADKLLIPMCPRIFEEPKSEEDIIEYVKSKPLSLLSNIPQIMEGVVCRSDPLMLFRKKPMISSDPLIFADYYAPIMWKLKCKEF